MQEMNQFYTSCYLDNWKRVVILGRPCAIEGENHVSTVSLYDEYRIEFDVYPIVLLHTTSGYQSNISETLNWDLSSVLTAEVTPGKTVKNIQKILVKHSPRILPPMFCNPLNFGIFIP